MDRTGVARFTIPIYHYSHERERICLAGSGFMLRLDSRVVLITAAHVSDHVIREELCVPANGRFMSFPLQWLRTCGDSRDHTDVAIAPLREEDARAMMVDYECATIENVDDRIITAPEPMSVTGYPLSRNKTSRGARKILSRLSLQQGQHVSMSHPAFSELRPLNNLVIHLPLHNRRSMSGHSSHSPYPKGMSGGPIWSVDGRTFHEQRILCFRGIVGVGIEYHKATEVVVGTHIGTVLQTLTREV